MMGSIYRNASRVVAWVGDSSRGAGALTVLRAIATNQPSAPKEYWNHQEIRELLQGDGYKWQKVTELFRSDFFGRRWIIQELVLAKDVVLKHGHEELPWSDMSVCLSRDNSLKDSVMAWSDEIMTGIAWATKIAFIRFLVWGVDANEETLERLSPALRDFAQAIIDSRDGGGTGIGCLPLGTLLGLSTGFQATEPKDAVYAVLGLARDEWKGRITIDYSNHTSEAQVVQDATRFVLTTPSEQLDLLQHAGCGYSGGPEMWVDPISLRRLRPRKTFSLFARNPKPRDLALSSWVPHYNTSYLEHPIFDDQGYWAGRPKGGPGKEINEVADENGEIIPALISMSASAVGCIAQMGGVYTAADDEKAENLCLRRFLTEAARLASHISRDQYHPEDVDNVIWRTIFGDCEAQRGPPFQDEELGRLRAATLCVADLTPPWPGPAPAIDRADVSRADIRRAMSALHKASLARRLAITDRGHLGLVPPGSVVGDLVCIIWGASMPFVVRQLARRQQEDTTDRDEHVLVGGCYLHGFMLGQATPREYPATTMIFR
ncbi:hypothetical protein B0T24DRAFT_609704 [Lasiosphaeria ovina]|uniref:Heterokaryon incompatibility domain-containing protein n=1 Tax=Lasiosphaeria ovina TaxID=92902 RepID=A0AAE0NCU7_9PEZI|nr:hypothetical protein B0T24DRAFT_609704 [Lasiosphaeria ovina]